MAHLVVLQVEDVDRAVGEADGHHVHGGRLLHEGDAARVAAEVHDQRPRADVPELQLSRGASDEHLVEICVGMEDEGGGELLTEVDRPNQFLRFPVPHAHVAVAGNGHQVLSDAANCRDGPVLALQRGDDRETPPLQDIAVHSGQRPFLAHLQRTRVKRAKYSSPDRFCQLGRGHNHMEVPRIIYLEGLSDGNGQEGVRAYALANSAHNQPS